MAEGPAARAAPGAKGPAPGEMPEFPGKKPGKWPPAPTSPAAARALGHEGVAGPLPGGPLIASRAQPNVPQKQREILYQPPVPHFLFLFLIASRSREVAAKA